MPHMIIWTLVLITIIDMTRALTQAKSISNTHSNGADAPWSAHPAYVSVVDVPTGIIYKIKQKIFLNS